MISKFEKVINKVNLLIFIIKGALGKDHVVRIIIIIIIFIDFNLLFLFLFDFC